MSDTDRTIQPGDGPEDKSEPALDAVKASRSPRPGDPDGPGAAPDAGAMPGTASPKAARAAVDETPPPPPMNPYMAGVFLGLTLLASYLILGAGLGASGAFARLGAWAEHLAAPARVEASAYFGPWFPAPLSYYLVFMAVGVFAGGLLSAVAGKRVRLMVERGPTSTRKLRLVFTLVGGVLTGFASRLAMGCTSGQALSGGALLLTGSFVFMGCVFATGYVTAWAFRRQWK